MNILLKYKEHILLFLILIFAAFLRLYKIADYMTFLGDEGRDVLVVYNILHGHLTLLGPTSSVGGFFLGPVYYYFMAPFLWLFNYNPVGPAVMVGLFGVATVWLVYKTGKEFFNASVGLVAAFLYSISPVVIAYSRSSWNPNLMPFFTLLALYVLYKAVNRKGAGGREFIVCGILLGILMQLHYLATFVVFIAGVYVLVTGVLRYKMYDAGIKNILRSYVLHLISLFLGFLIGFSPFLAFEVRHGFPNIISIFKFIFQSQEVSGSGDFFLTIQNVFFRLFGRLVTAFPPPEQISVQAHQDLMIWYICTWILALASFGYFVYMFIKGTKGWVLLFLWFTIGIFLFGFYRKQIYDYYFGFLFPLPFLFVSVFLAFLWQKKIYFKIIAVVIFLGLTYRNLQGMPFLSSPNQQMEQVKSISKFVVNKTNNKPYNFALITGGNSDHAYRYFFTIWGKSPVTILSPAVDAKRKSVTDQLLVVCETFPCAPLGHSLWEIAGFGRAEIAGEWDVSVVKVYRLVRYRGK